MRLETAGEFNIDNVTEAQLRQAFDDDAGRGEFIILSQDDQAYMQASGEGDGPYELEYREGDAEHHFQAGDEFRKEQILQAFVWYLTGDPRWHTQFLWEKLDASPRWKLW